MSVKVRDCEKHPIPSPLASYGARIDRLVYGSTRLTRVNPAQQQAVCWAGSTSSLLR